MDGIHTFSEKLKKALEKSWLSCTDIQAEQFFMYFSLLKERNSQFNLTAIEDEDGVIEKHFRDSLLPLCTDIFKGGDSCADIGSGAGFPAIPLAIMRSNASFTMIESIGKRTTFLEEVIHTLGLTNCQVICSRAEDCARTDLRESFDLVFSRAVSRLNVLCELCLPLVKTGGAAVALKSVSAKTELEEAQNAIRLTGGGEARIFGTDERNIVIIKKLSQTDEKYPRRAGMPSKKPL